MTPLTTVCSACGQRYDDDVIFCPKDGTPLSGRKTQGLDDPYVGIRLADQLSLQQLIGIGAMGRVYRAHQRGIDRDVAVKILHRELLRNPTVKARFLREAKVASRLSHPNVVQVLMTGEVEKHSADIGGEAYLVMEYLDGISLRSALGAEGGSLPLPRALHVMLQVCDAVGEGHSQGVVHRDLKPENVMLVRRGDDPDFVKVLDFGVARIDWADNTVATQAGVIFGTARYISPEGAQGKQVTAASDVYSIAVMLFQCLSGSPPFDADSPVGILIKHTNEPPPQLTDIERASYVPKPIADVVMQNLAKDPAKRAENARVLGRMLVTAARKSGLSPDELMVRSTLMSKGTLSLESIQRTKALPLSESLEQKLRGGSGETEVIDDGGSSATETGARDAASETEVDAATETEVDSRPSIEPTLSDEGAPNSQDAPTRPGPESRPSIPTLSDPGPTSVPEPQRSYDELPESVPPPPLERSRAPLILICFVLGGILAFFAARQMGVFGDKQTAVDRDIARAHAAFERGAYDAPVGDNVREITDTALRRHPGNPALLRVRRNAADRLRLAAEAARGVDPPRAQDLAQRALALDPENEAAQLILRASTLPSKAAEKAPGGAIRPPPKGRPGGPKAGGAVDAGESDARVAPSASAPAGGRWL